ncbi:MAG TPA: hypothetical protein VH395_09065 [Jatrophihabitantaceae bacterium]|jgi:hypothetical protein
MTVDVHDHHEPLLPRPPPAKTMVDFVVQIFVLLVSLMLCGAVAALLALALFTDRDLTIFFKTITDIITTLIGALIGFIAGKNSANVEPPP